MDPETNNETTSFTTMLLAILSSAITLSIAAAITAFYCYRKFWCHTYFKRMGIPGPEPHWLFGNLLAMADESRRHLQLQQWSKQYKGVYGYYEGSTPILVTSDLELAKQICIKQFDTFNARKGIPFVDDPDSDSLHTNLFLARGLKWRRLRNSLNPSFSTGSLRRMAPVMYKCITRLVQELENAATKTGSAEMELYEKYQEMAGEVILEACYGIDMDEQRDVGRAHEIFKNMAQCIKEETNFGALQIADTILPEFDAIFRVIQSIQEKLYGVRAAARYCESLAEMMIQRRKKDPSSRRADLLQLMLDAENTTMSEEDRADAKRFAELDDQQLEDLASADKAGKGLTTIEIQSTCVLFMVAGFETTSTALTFASYLLAMHPEVQEKLHQEIVAKVKFDSSGRPDPMSLSECHYLDWVLKETLRLYPVAVLVLNRAARRDTSIGGIDIPKGLVVHVDQMSLHLNAELWGPVDPKEFYPERFAPDYGRNSDPDGAAPMLSFGYGNRKCIGARFADQEVKIALAMILRRLQLQRSEATKVPLPLTCGMTLAPSQGVHLRIVPRK